MKSAATYSIHASSKFEFMRLKQPGASQYESITTRAQKSTIATKSSTKDLHRKNSSIESHQDQPPVLLHSPDCLARVRMKGC
jgi:hypothetical protein